MNDTNKTTYHSWHESIKSHNITAEQDTCLCCLELIKVLKVLHKKQFPMDFSARDTQLSQHGRMVHYGIAIGEKGDDLFARVILQQENQNSKFVHD